MEETYSMKFKIPIYDFLNLTSLEEKADYLILIKVVHQKPTANIIINDETVNTHDSRKKMAKKQKIRGLCKENPEDSHYLQT